MGTCVRNRRVGGAWVVGTLVEALRSRSLGLGARSSRIVHAGVVAVAAAVMAVAGVGSAVAAPEPDPIPRRWQLAIEPGPLRVATVDVEGQGPKAYFYMTYTVTNTTDQDLLFAPSFDLANDQGDLQRSGRNVPAAVTRELLTRLENPYLEDQISIVGNLLQGEANAKDGLVAWPVETLSASEMSVYAAGFSGETRTVDIRHPRTGQPARHTLRKTLMLRFQTPGELRDQGSRPLEMTERRWILR